MTLITPPLGILILIIHWCTNFHDSILTAEHPEQLRVCLTFTVERLDVGQNAYPPKADELRLS